jgi:hypothetical protein
MHIRSTAKTDFLFALIVLFSGLLQAVSSPSQTASPDAQEPLKIDAYTGTKNQRNKPRAAYAKYA